MLSFFNSRITSLGCALSNSLTLKLSLGCAVFKYLILFWKSFILALSFFKFSKTSFIDPSRVFLSLYSLAFIFSILSSKYFIRVLFSSDSLYKFIFSLSYDFKYLFLTTHQDFQILSSLVISFNLNTLREL